MGGKPFEKGSLEFAVIKVKASRCRASCYIRSEKDCDGAGDSEGSRESGGDREHIRWTGSTFPGTLSSDKCSTKFTTSSTTRSSRFWNGGTHKPLSWDECYEAVGRFKEDVIFTDMVETEAESRSMME